MILYLLYQTGKSTFQIKPLKNMNRKINRVFAIVLSFILIFQQAGFAEMAAQLNLAGYLGSLHSAFTPDKFRPLHLRYLSYDNLNNSFRLLLDKGDTKNPQPQELETTTKTLLNYFFVGLALPNDSFWVNLRPDSEDNVIDPWLAQTDIGKIMLETDLQLKKDTAKATSPETPEGRKYWDSLYKKAEELFGYENVTIPTLTRPWIVPGEIIIRETTDSAYIYKATLKVMLEQDYLKDSATYNFKDPRLKALNEYSSQLIRELIIPKLTKEVNSSKRYASLRQVYYSLIMAQWFKARFRNKPWTCSQAIDHKNLTNLTSKISWTKTTYFQDYQKSFKDGEYNIQEPRSAPFGQVIRSYFSGGQVLNTGVMASPGAVAGTTNTGVSFTAAQATAPPVVNTRNVEITVEGDRVHVMAGGSAITVKGRNDEMRPGESIDTYLARLREKYGQHVEIEIVYTKETLQRKARDHGFQDDVGGGFGVAGKTINDKAYICLLYDAVMANPNLAIHEITEALGRGSRGIATGGAETGVNNGDSKEERRKTRERGIAGAKYSPAAQTSKQFIFNLLTLEANDINLPMRDDLTTLILSQVYPVLVATGQMTLSDLEARLKDRHFRLIVLREVYPALVATGQMTLSDLEAKARDADHEVRHIADQALGRVYVSLAAEGKMTLSDLEAKGIHRNTFEVLMQGYFELVTTGNMPLPVFEAKVKELAMAVHLDTLLTNAYVSLVEEGNMALSDLEAKARDTDPFIREEASLALRRIIYFMQTEKKGVFFTLKTRIRDWWYGRQEASSRALGQRYAALAAEGKMPLSALEAKLKDADGRQRQPVLLAFGQTLGQRYAKLVEQGKILDTDYAKYKLWSAANLVYVEEILAEFMEASDPQAFLEEVEQAGIDVQNGKFDINNKLHLFANYVQLLEQAKNNSLERIGALTWLDYQQELFSRTGREGDAESGISSEQRKQVRGLVYEGYLLRQRILEIQQRAQTLSRPVVVVENLSYGAVATSPITEERNGTKYIIGTDIPVISTKVGSTECHNDEFYIRPDLFTEAEQRLLLTEKPIVIVVDASTSVSAPGRSSPHIPDGFKGYRNYFIAIDTALGRTVNPADFQEDSGFLAGLDADSRFGYLVRVLQVEETHPATDDPYRLFFWYPGDKPLYLRVAKRKDTPAPKLESANDITGPSIIFVQAAMEYEAVPEEIRDNFIGGNYEPAYFDDKEHFKQFILAYEEGYGLVFSRSFIDLARNYFRDFMAQYEAELVPTAAAPSASDDEATGWGGGYFRRQLDEVRRLQGDGRKSEARKLLQEVHGVMKDFETRLQAAAGDHAREEEIANQFMQERGISDPLEDPLGDLPGAMRIADRLAKELGERIGKKSTDAATTPSPATPTNDKGGIDFRYLPIVTQAISNLRVNLNGATLQRLSNINVDEELTQLQRMLSSGITPSTERIREYIQASCTKGDFNKDKVILCISDILRIEEEYSSTEPMLRDILVVLESSRSTTELKEVFLGKKI
jgi:hypothetical protein